MRANRVIFGVASVLMALFLVGGVLAVLALRSIGWVPGTRSVHMLGSAMAPTVANGDYLLVQPYSASNPRQGDIVLMRDPGDRSRSLIERVVAGPSQTIVIRDAQVLVDGRPLSEPYVAQEPWTAGTEWPLSGSAVRLGADENFVLGDNRNHSADSRTYGPVRRGDIWGRAVRILAPSQRARTL